MAYQKDEQFIKRKEMFLGKNPEKKQDLLKLQYDLVNKFGFNSKLDISFKSGEYSIEDSYASLNDCILTLVSVDDKFRTISNLYINVSVHEAQIWLRICWHYCEDEKLQKELDEIIKFIKESTCTSTT